MKFTFPKDFMFGVASSAVQIEAASFEDGKGIDVWQHRYTLDPAKYDYHDTDFGANFYHKYPEDIKLMKELGIKAFRFSIAWTRIYPNGPDKVNKAGIDHYHKLFDELIKNDIKPLIDLWHCDLPQWVMDRGGLVNPEFIDWFVTYAKTCFKEYGDKIPYWTTVNEPQCNIMAPYAWGIQPPYEKDIKKANIAGHHMILAHFKTVKAYREMGYKGKIGIVNHFQLAYGATLDEKDQAAAERDMDFYSYWYTDAIYAGHYPESILKYPYMKDNMPENYQKDLDENFVKSDFIGVNYYGAYNVEYVDNGVLDYKVAPSKVTDSLGFSPNAAGIFDALNEIIKKYPGYELIISENGAGGMREGAYEDSATYEKELDDEYRVTCIREHLRGLSRCLEVGFPVTGYFHWTLLDTTEGAGGGFSRIFGMVQVRFDKEERTRVPRKSFYYYKDVIAKGYVE